MSSSAGTGGASATSSSRSGANNADREAFNNSLRSRAPKNAYISHLKVQESEAEQPGKPKTRYLITAVDRETGRVTLNKARKNSNMTYSIGKDWDLNLLQAVEVLTPTSFTITLSRPYGFTSDRAPEQEAFLQMIVNVYRRYTGDEIGPTLVGLTVQPNSSRSGSSSRATASSSSASQTASSATSVSASEDAPPRQSTSSTHSTTSSQGQSLRALNVPLPTMNAAAVSPTTPTGETAPPMSPFGASPIASPSRRHEREADTATLHHATSSSHLRAPRPAQSNGTATPLQSRRSPMIPQEPVLSAADDDDDDPYGGAVVSDLPVPAPQPTPAYATPPKPTIPMTNSSYDAQTATKIADPNDFPSPRARTTQQSLRRMGSSPHMANGVQVPRRSESIPDLARAAGRRPGTAGSQTSRSRAPGPERAATPKSPTTPTAEQFGSWTVEEVKDTPPPPPSMPPVPTISEPPAEAKAVARSKAPHRVARTLSKVLPIDGDGDDDDDDQDLTLAYVEEMLEGLEWRPMIGEGGFGTGFSKRRRVVKPSDTLFGGSVATVSSRGGADVIEARLLKELSALEEANIHSMVESDERVGLVIKHMDDALVQLDLMESMIMRFKMQLNGRDEDINHIESQNGALQIHTSNQQKLAAEIERLLDTIHVDEGSIYTLKHASLESRGGIEELERAAGELYKSILQGTSTTDESVSAATERLDEYRALSERFCKRVYDHINLTLTAETASLLSDPARQAALSPSRHPGPSLQNHAHLEELLGRYCGLVLYMKETNPPYFSRLCAAYYASVSECWKREMATFLAGWKRRIKRGQGDDYGWEVGDSAEGGAGGGGRGGYEGKGSGELGAFGRAATIRRVVRGDKGKAAKAQDDGDLSATDVFQRVLDSLTPLIQGEQTFIADFLQINDANVTFADYCDMEPYFRRRAAQLFGFGTAAHGSGPMREMKGALELIFGYLAQEADALVDYAVHMDKSQITPILALLDRAMGDAEEVGADFIVRTLTRMHTRLSAVLDKIEDEQQNAEGGAGAGNAGTQGKAAGEKKKKRVANLLRKHR